MLSIAGLHHGGAERVVASLCTRLNPQRFSITVCWRTGIGNIGEDLQAQGFELVGLPEIDPDASPYLRFLVLRRLLKKLQIDVIHTHDTGSLADAAQCRLLGSSTKIVHTFHFGNYPNLEKTHLYMETIFSRLAHRLIAVGHEQSKAIQRALHLSGSRMSTLYNGVEDVITSSRSVEKIQLPVYPDGAVVIGSVSTLTKQKGLFVLLDAAALLHKSGVHCVFLIAGGGPLQPGLERRVRELGLSDMVHFLGWVENAANSLLPLLDVFCQSSLWEANSIVLLEAMSASLPIVTTAAGDSRHVIDQNECGIVVDTGDAAALADALIQLVDNVERRNAMGTLAKEKFDKNYTVDTMIESYESLYESLVKT